MTIIWQADLSRRPFIDSSGSPLWALLICRDDGSWQFSAQAPQTEINSQWVKMQLSIAQLDHLDATSGRPQKIQVFRPQSFSLIAAGAEPLGISVEATRQTPALKKLLLGLKRTALQTDWNPIRVEAMPPVPLPERLRGDRWRFAALPAGELEAAFQDRPIPIIEMPEVRSPLRLGLRSTQPIPGLIIDGGRASMQLARWLQGTRPYALDYKAGAPDGVILQAGLAERWVMATFEDAEMAQAAQTFEQRKREALGLHFLLVQPDDSGMTYSGIWLLQI